MITALVFIGLNSNWRFPIYRSSIKYTACVILSVNLLSPILLKIMCTEFSILKWTLQNFTFTVVLDPRKTQSLSLLYQVNKFIFADCFVSECFTICSGNVSGFNSTRISDPWVNTTFPWQINQMVSEHQIMLTVSGYFTLCSEYFALFQVTPWVFHTLNLLYHSIQCFYYLLHRIEWGIRYLRNMNCSMVNTVNNAKKKASNLPAIYFR